jgi:integrase
MRSNKQQPLVFARHSLGGINRGPDGPLSPSGVYQRAQRLWGKQGIGRLTLHPARHTYASLIIAAGENVKAVQAYLGHSSITTTFDRYGHLFPGAEQESAQRLQRFLDAAAGEIDPADHPAEQSAEPADTGRNA